MRTQCHLLCMLSAAVVLSSCAMRQPSADPAPQLATAPAYVPAGPTRGDQECQAALDSVAAHQLVVPPARMRTILMPPRPPRGQAAVITLHVNAQGAVMADSTEINGVTDPEYLTRLRAMAAESTFWPTVVNGCAVPATAQLKVESTP